MITNQRPFWKRLAAAAIVLAVGMGGGVALASHGFSDVPNSNIFHEDIDFLVSREITLGCGGNKFCPKDNVTREQMAAFLERTARALTPVVLSGSEPGLVAGTPACVLGPFVPEVEMIAVLHGGVYGQGPERIASRVIWRANGGDWIDAKDSFWVFDEPEDGKFGAAPVGGNVVLNPGLSYEFAVDAVFPGSGAAGCMLHATISHQMPGLAVGAQAQPPQPDPQLEQLAALGE